MKASDSTLKNLLEGVKQFIIPIYQRQYQWQPDKRKHKMMTVEKMWNDIEMLMDSDETQSHFFGAIVILPLPHGPSELSKYLVIDGQQRLISTTLLLTVIRDLSRELNLTDSKYENFDKSIEDNYIFNQYKRGEEKYKIIPTKPDKDSYFSILDNDKNKTESNNNLVKSYNYFFSQVKNYLDKLPDSKSKIEYLIKLESVLLHKMKIVEVLLSEKEDDNPKDVFESLNYAGIPLSNWDLVKNYLLMPYNSDNQDEIYNKFIYFIEKNIYKNEDEFLRNYLGMKGKVVVTKNIYNEFKNIMKDLKNEEWDKAINEIKNASNYFNWLKNPEKIIFPINKSIIDDIKFFTKILNTTVHYPVLMKLFLLFENGNIDERSLYVSIKLINSYLLRMTICSPDVTKSLNKFFPIMAKDIINNEPEKTIREDIKKEGYYKIPDDQVFMTSLMNYKFSSPSELKLVKKLLYEIEKTLNKEVPDIENLEVEHIMPKTLTEEWKKELGEEWQRIYNQYLHTIGNLTLTGYNSEMKNFSFDKKKNMQNGYKDSSIKITKNLSSISKWDENEIKQRLKELSEKIIEIWKID